MAARKANELDEILACWAREQDAEEAAAALRARGLCAASVRDTRGVMEDPHLRARGFFVEVDHPEVGQHLQVGVP